MGISGKFVQGVSSMIETDESSARWRALILKTCVSIAVSVILVEFGIFINFYLEDALETEVWQYISVRVAIPALLNFGMLFIASAFNRDKKSTESVKNHAVMIVFTLMCAIVACAHSFFVTTLTTFSMPIIATSIFADKKLTDRITVISLAGVIAGFAFSIFDGRDAYPFRLGELIVALTIVMISHLMTKILVKNSFDKQQMLRLSIVNELKLKEQLNFDGLTKLYNYTAFVSKLDKEVINYRTEKGTLLLAILDIDDFKAINDRFGHDCGNDALVAIAELLNKYCTTNGFPARYGGEEFAVLFFDISMQQAIKTIERVRADLNEADIPGLQRGTVRFSCGIAKYDDRYTAKAFFNEADQAMYYAKAKGKNRTATDTDLLKSADGKKGD